MKLTLATLLIFIAGYIIARFFPQPGNMLGLPNA